MAAPTPCLGRHALYDTVLDPKTPAEERHQAQTVAAALCGRCPIAPMCPDRVTRPANPPRNRKDNVMPVTDITPPAAPKLDPADLMPSTPEALIEWGARHQSSRIQSLAGKARGALADLRQAAEREIKAAEAEARVKRLEAQLAEAKQDLRAARGGTSAPAHKHGATTSRPNREELAKIRTWARQNGYKVAPAGVIARTVTEAYYAAQKPAPLAKAS